MEKQGKNERAKRVMGIVLLVSLVLAAVFTLIRLLTFHGDGMQRSNYTLMLVQCIMGVVVMLLPSAIEHKWSIPIPNFIYVLYYVFLYCAVFLGEVFSFYYRVPYWDKILHLFSGGMLGALGFILVSLLNENVRVNVQLSPFFVALFAFSFAVACGAVWEVYEFTMDSVMGLNMQKYMLETGETLIGRDALLDTMSDIISDAASALVVSAISFVQLSRKQKCEKEPVQT